MKSYNVMFFDTDFNLLYYTNANDIEYKEDYMNLLTSEVTILLSDATILSSGDYIYITRDNESYFGIVSGTSTANDEQVEVSFQSFLVKFDQPILFDTDKQGADSFEQTIGSIINEIWVKNDVTSGTDSSEEVVGLTVSIKTRTVTDWTLDLETDVTDSHYAKVSSILDTFILNGMKKYSVYINVIPHFTSKSIEILVGADSTVNKTIEADLPNIIKKDIVISTSTERVNKLIVYDSTLGESMRANPIVYYLHTDDTYSTENNLRITPVVRDIDVVSSSDESSFDTLAASSAKTTFATKDYSNYIELTVKTDDTLVNPAELVYGQNVHIIHNGTQYTSILTGKEVSDGKTKLIFGTLRLTLTTKL